MMTWYDGTTRASSGESIDLDGASLEMGGDFTANLTSGIGLFAAADYKTNLGGGRTKISKGMSG